MTESEAKTKWCPIFAVATAIKSQDDNVPAELLETFKKCKGSACMMWRVTNSAIPVANMHEGYCGLAGKP